MLSRVASWHHGSAVTPIFAPMRCRSSSRPCSVIFGNSRAIVVCILACMLVSSTRCSLSCFERAGPFALAQRFAVHLAGRCLGKFVDECNEARIFVLAQPAPDEFLQLPREGLVARPVGDDEGF